MEAANILPELVNILRDMILSTTREIQGDFYTRFYTRLECLTVLGESKEILRRAGINND
jgi:hypothetical protein